MEKIDDYGKHVQFFNPSEKYAKYKGVYYKFIEGSWKETTNLPTNTKEFLDGEIEFDELIYPKGEYTMDKNIAVMFSSETKNDQQHHLDKFLKNEHILEPFWFRNLGENEDEDWWYFPSPKGVAAVNLLTHFEKENNAPRYTPQQREEPLVPMYALVPILVVVIALLLYISTQ